MNKFRAILSVGCLLLISKVHALGSGTVVGNGGDPVFEFMEAARLSMIESINVVINNPEEQKHFCEKSKLSVEQISFCREFFSSVAPSVLQLSQGMNKTLFVLREEPLCVQGPDGKPMVVAARTELGSQGVIELHRDSVKTMLPTQVLMLIMHEFQHKVFFRDRSVTDNESIGPFATGRDLLDTVASALVVVARKHGKVGTQFGIRDIFECRGIAGSSQFGALLSSSRLFQAEDLMSYETSLGRNPTDGLIFIPESATSSLILRIVINEPNNCGDPHVRRKNLIQIIRKLRQENGNFVETVVAQINSTVNPMCPGSDPQFEISEGSVKFICRYFGSEGTTSSSVSTARH